MVNYDKAISDILSLINIVDVISRYTNVKKFGNSYKALCPFHEDKKTPSLSISPDKGLYHCFGCGASGNIITFVSEIEGISKGEAIKKLATEIGIDLSSGYKSTERENMKKVMSLAENFFHKTLFNEINKNRLLTDFIKKRNLSENSAKKFKLGFCPYSAKAFLKELSLYNIDPKFAYDLKLIYTYNNEPVFGFKYRFMFPIKNIIGETIAFGGRVIDNNEKVGKYINSSNSLIYNKGYTLFGLNYSKEFIKEKGYAILVEGYFDMLSLHAAGIQNSIASSGTALTEYQVTKIKKFTDSINVFYDSDAPGQKAAFRSIEILFRNGMDGKVFNLPVKDPDEFIEKFGKEKFEEFMENEGIDLKEYYLSYLKNSYDLSKKKEREKAYDTAMTLLRSISDVEIKTQMLEKIAKFFNFQLIFVEEDYKKKYSGTHKGKRETGLKKQQEKSLNNYDKALHKLLVLILHHINIFEEKLDILQSTGLLFPSIYKDILIYLTDYLSVEENSFSPNAFLEYISNLDIEQDKQELITKTYGELAFEEFTLKEKPEGAIERLYYISKGNSIDLMINVLKNNIIKCKTNQEKDRIYGEIQDLTLLKQKINKKIGGNFYG
ncbi:DNA primase [bacterium]|nr:DNA primase [bacterium]